MNNEQKIPPIILDRFVLMAGLGLSDGGRADLMDDIEQRAKSHRETDE